MSAMGAHPPTRRRYPVRFTTAAVHAPHEQNGFGEFFVESDSSETAVWMANGYLQKIDIALRTRYVLKQEIQLPDGWRYFTAKGIDDELRKEPGLDRRRADTLYRCQDHYQPLNNNPI